MAATVPGHSGKAQTAPDPLKRISQQNTSAIARQHLSALRSLRFEPTPDGAAMVSRSERRSLRINSGGSVEIHSVLSGKSADVELRLEGSDPASAVKGSQVLPSHTNYFLGKDPAKWRTGVSHFGQARVDGVYPGIDLLYYGNGEALEHDYQLAPNADPVRIRMRIDGEATRIDASSGDLIVSQAAPVIELLRLHKPVAYQAKSDGSRDLVAAAYQQNSDGSFSFSLGEYDRSRPLTIDPVITYSTYFGGSYDDGVNDVKLDAAGNIYLLLQTSSVDMPVTSQIAGACKGMCGPNNPGTASAYTSYDYFVAKLDPTGQKLLFSTYIGGSQSDDPGALLLGTDGKIYISGQTFSPDFPVVNEHSSSLAPLGIFGEQTTTSTLTVLSADGSKILYSTFIGGGFTLEQSAGVYVGYGYDGGRGLGNAPSSLAVASDGIVYLLGYATTITPGSGLAKPFYDAKGTDFLTGGGSFIAKFDTTKVGADSLIYARPFGSPGDEQGQQFSGIALDSKQNLWVFGQVGLSAPPPTPDAVQPVCGAGGASQCQNAFLFAMNPAGTITYSTYLGGTTTQNGGVPTEHPEMIYIDPADNIYLSGLTQSSDFPTVNAAYTAATVFSTGGGFLTKLSAGGQSILYSTYLPERNSIIAATPEGMAAAVVATGGGQPVVNGLAQNSSLGSGVDDAYILLLDTTKAGTASVTSLGYLGSTGAIPGAVAFDAQQNLVLGGSVYGSVPVVNPYQGTCSGACQGTANDGFLTRIQYQAGKLTLTPATESFPNTAVGSTSTPLTATLTNSTAQTITLSVPSQTDSIDFTDSDNCNGSITSGASCTITLTFRPATAGTLSATYSIANANQPASPLTIKLSGVGMAVASPGTLAPTTLDFGNLTVGSTSGVQSALLTNTGTADYQVSSITQSSSAILVHTSFCARPVAAGAYCKVEVTVAPTAVGAFTGSVIIKYFLGDGSNPSQNFSSTLTVTATGIAPAVTLTPASADFGSIAGGQTSTPQTFTVTNNYTTAVSLAQLTIGGPFRIQAGATCISGAQLPAGQSCTIPVSFVPVSAGAASGTLYLSYIGSSGGPVQKTSQLTGTGAGSFANATLTPISYDFGDVTVGATSHQFLYQLTNTGSVALHPKDATISVFGFKFPATSATTCTGSNTLSPGASCNLAVSFAPTKPGIVIGTLSIPTEAGTKTASVSGTGIAPTGTFTPATYNFGNVTEGYTSSQFLLTLTNTSNVPLHTSGPLSSSRLFIFPVTTATTCTTFETVAPGGSCTLAVQFSPTAAGTVTTTVSIQTEAGTNTATLIGTGVVPTATITPANYNFGGVIVGSTSSQVLLKFTNTSLIPLHPGNATTTLLGLHFPISTATTCTGSSARVTLQPGDSCNLAVDFAPTTAGIQTGVINIPSEIPITSTTVTGTGVAPALPPSLLPSMLSFGNVTVGATSAAQTITFTNPASFPLTLESIGLVGSGFSIQTAGTTCKTGPAIAAHASCTLSILFSPATAGVVSGSLTVGLPAGFATSSLIASLTGTGVMAVVSPEIIDFTNGFTPAGLTLNGATTVSGGMLQLTANRPSQASSAFYPTAVSTTGFSTDFAFQLRDPLAEGITFTIQGDSPTAIGSKDGGLGYEGIAKSIALKFDLRDTNGEGDDSTGVYVNGAAPTVPAASLAASGIDLHSGDVFTLHVSYDGTTESITLMDSVTGATWSTKIAENIPGIIGSNQAYFGFTASTGAATAASASIKPAAAAAGTTVGSTANILYWAYSSKSDGPAALQPIRLDFGNVTVGSTSGVQTAELTNTGTTQFQVASITPSDPSIKIHSSLCSRPVVPGTYCHLAVTLSPTATASFTGSVVINYYLGDGSTPAQNFSSTLKISGNGVASGVTLTPSSHDFGSVAAGITSAPQIFTVTNNYSTAVSLAQFTIAGPFRIAPGATCGSGALIPVGQSCAIPVSFVPVSAGATTGTLYVSYVDPVGGPVSKTASLTGTGTGSFAHSTLTPISYDFGNVNIGATSNQFLFQLTNTGSVPLHPANPTVSVLGFQFPVTSATTCNGSNGTALAPGASCYFAVAFVPKEPGIVIGTLSISSEAGTKTASVSGTGVTPPTVRITPAAVNFGNVPVGTNVSQTFILTNTSTTATIAGGVSLNSSLDAFILNLTPSTCGLTYSLGPEQSCTFDFTFLPVMPGAATATLTLTNNAGTQTITLAGTGVAPPPPPVTPPPTFILTPTAVSFGNVPIGNSASQTFTFTNTSNTTIAGSFTLNNSGGFILDFLPSACNLTYSLAPGQSCTFHFEFSPITPGAATATLTLTNNAGTQTITMTGTGVAASPSFVRITPAAVNFGSVPVGTNVSQTFILTNTSTTATIAGGVSLNSSLDAFILNLTPSTCGLTYSLGPEQSCTFDFTFLPVMPGAATATLTLTNNAGTQTITLSGTGVAPPPPPVTPPPTFILTPTAVDFGSVPIGNSASQTFTFTNTSNTTIAGSFTLNNSGGFILDFLPSACNLTYSLAPGQSCTFHFEFSPITPGAATATLTLTNNAGTQTITLSGTGINTGGSAAIDFGKGFTANALKTTGPATVVNGMLQLTSGLSAAASSAFFPTAVTATNFTTDVTFQLLDPTAEGITFTIQGDGPNAVGAGGAGLGYQGLPKSVAIKFDLKDTAGEGTDSTGIYVNGAAPTVPAISLAGSGIDLHSGHVFALHLDYDGTTASVSLTDTVIKAVWKAAEKMDIPGIVGGNTAYVGFTAGSGLPALFSHADISERPAASAATVSTAAQPATATTNILTWTYSATPGTQTSQTIAFPSFAGETYGAAPVILTATATSNLPVTYTVTGPAKLSGSALAITGAGTVAVTATQPGNTTFAAAAAVTQSFVVAKAPLTVKADNRSRVLGAANPPLTYSVIGLVDGDTLAVVSGTATLASAAMNASPAGSYPITFATRSLIAANYSFTYVAGTLTVTPLGAQCTTVDYSKGFTATGLTLNGSAKIAGGLLQLTNGKQSEAGSAYFSSPLPTSSFITGVTFQLVDPLADGITLTIQAAGPHALGEAGGGLGYAGIPRSIALKFDLHNNAGEGTNSTGLYYNGAYPSEPSTSLDGSGLDLHSGDVFELLAKYNGITTKLTLTDTKTKTTWTGSMPGNIADAVGSDVAYFGFTGGTGQKTAIQNILTWTYTGGKSCTGN